MAEPATQSPYISSSAGGSGSSSESGGRDLKVSGGSSQPCADSFVSSSQPVSLFSTSQGGTTSPPPTTDKSTSKGPVPPSPVMSSSEEAPALSLAHSTNRNETDRKSALSGAGRELVNGQKWDHFFGVSDGLGTESLSLGSPGLKEPSIESNSTAVVHTKDRNNFQAEVPAGVKADLSNHDQRFPDQTPKTVSGEESKFALPTIPKKEPEGLPARVTYSHSAPIAGEAVVEKDSPESPFEVIADKLEFDKEFKDVLGSNSGNTDNNWVMHGKRELLHDIPEDGVCEFQVKPRVGGRLPSGPGLSRQSSGTTAALEEVSKCVRDLHSFTNEMLNWDLIPKDLDDKPDDSESSVPPVSLAKDSGVKADMGKASSPPRPLTISAHQKVKPPLGAEENHILVASVKPTLAASTELKADVRWPNPNPPEAADPDSSGESDDTIIEDATADPAFQNEKATEINKAPPKPAALVSVDRVTKEGPSDKNSKHVPEDGGFMPSKTPEGSWGFIDDFEDIPDKEDVLGGSPVAVSLLPKQSARGTVGQESGPQERDLFGRGSGMEGLSSSPRVGLPLDTLKEGACPDNLNGESFMDFMKECLKAKGRESPEDPVETFSEAELRAARSEVWVPRFQQPPKPTQDFEEHLTIKALMEVGRKSEMEKQSPTPSKVPSTGGRRPGHYYEMPPDPSMSAPKSALEKRPLCLEQAVDVKLASTSPGLSAHEFPGVPTKVSPASPLPYAIRKLLAEFSVHELIFWRDVKKTGLVFSTTLILLLSLAAFSVISVASYLILALLSVTISFRVYKSVIQAIQKSEDGHPFKAYLDLDVAVSSDTFHNYVSSTMVHVNHALKLIMRLFLVEDLVDSLKLAVVMWLMTYVGALFNGITLLILAELLVFSVPVVYEKYKTQIDHYVGIAREQIKSVVTKVQAKLPGVVKKKPE